MDVLSDVTNIQTNGRPIGEGIEESRHVRCSIFDGSLISSDNEVFLKMTFFSGRNYGLNMSYYMELLSI